MKTSKSSIIYSKVNYLAMWYSLYSLSKRGVLLSLVVPFVVIYVPGISWVFETKRVAWLMFGFVGLPFAMLPLIFEELRKRFKIKF